MIILTQPRFFVKPLTYRAGAQGGPVAAQAGKERASGAEAFAPEASRVYAGIQDHFPEATGRSNSPTPGDSIDSLYPATAVTQ